MQNSAMRSEIQRLIGSITSFDSEEEEQISFVQKWIASGVEIFRLSKPATPDTHLVSYFLLIDEKANKVLLTDHKKSGLWLPPGGHVEPGEHPQDAVKREIREELGIEADFLLDAPFFITVTKTVGQTAGHTDVSLWYALRGCATQSLEYDKEEFHTVHWFLSVDIPYQRTDPHMRRCIKKLVSLNLIRVE